MREGGSGLLRFLPAIAVVGSWILLAFPGYTHPATHAFALPSGPGSIAFMSITLIGLFVLPLPVMAAMLSTEDKRGFVRGISGSILLLGVGIAAMTIARKLGADPMTARTWALGAGMVAVTLVLSITALAGSAIGR